MQESPKKNGLSVAVATLEQQYAYINVGQQNGVWLLGFAGVETARQL